jgi:hypothetical protein
VYISILLQACATFIFYNKNDFIEKQQQMQWEGEAQKEFREK